MSKPVKEMIVEEYRRRFDGITGGVLVHIRGMDAIANNEMRNELRKKAIQVTLLKNTLARKAFEGPPRGHRALARPSAFVYGAESPVDVAREIVAWAKKAEEMELQAASLDGIFFEGAAGVRALSKYPTREGARANVVTLLLSPHKNVVGCTKSPGSKLLGVVKTIQEKLENGETIAKVG